MKIEKVTLSSSKYDAENKANVRQIWEISIKNESREFIKHLLNWPLSPILPHRQQLHKVTFVSPLFLSWDQDTYTYFIISVITIFSKSYNIPTQITIQVIVFEFCTEVSSGVKPQRCYKLFSTASKLLEDDLFHSKPRQKLSVVSF